MQRNDNSGLRSEFGDSAESKISWNELFRHFLAKSWLIALCAIAGFFAAAAYVRQLPETYKATSVLNFDSAGAKVLNFEDGQTTQFGNEASVQTILETFKSRALLNMVIEAEKLSESPDFMSPGPDQKAPSLDDISNYLSSVLAVQVRRGTQLIDITVQHPQARMAKLLADSLANQFIQLTIKLRTSSSEAVMRFLLGEAERLKTKLRKSEEDVQQYILDHDAQSLKPNQDTVIGKLQSQNAQLQQATSTRIRLMAESEEARRFGDNPKALLTLGSIGQHPSVVAIQKAITSIEARIATFALRYTEKHPRMIQARTELSEARSALNDAAKAVVPMIDSEYQHAVATEKRFKEALGEQEKIAAALNKAAIEYNSLQREVETDRALYESVITRLKENDITRNLNISNVRIFEAASLPLTPTDNHPRKLMLLGVLGGLVLGMGAVAGGYFIDNSWKSVDDAENATSLKVLASIPLCRRLKQSAVGQLLLKQPGSATAEAFRFLRTSLYLSAGKSRQRTFLFTSAMPGEGKTFCSVNYAVSAAQQGLRTLIIDADLRSPMVGSTLLNEEDLTGLAEYIRGEAVFEQVSYDSIIPNLTVIPAGRHAPNPAEMLTSPEFAALIEDMKTKFDTIVIDSSPLGPVTDTLLILEFADSVCMVVRAGRTSEKAVLRACNVLTEFGAKSLGIVINGVTERGGDGLYYASGSYGRRGYRAELEG